MAAIRGAHEGLNPLLHDNILLLLLLLGAEREENDSSKRNDVP